MREYYIFRDRTRSKNDYGDFQFRRSWTSGNDYIKNTIVNCPLFRRCGCQCQAKIVQTPVQTILSISNSHTAADHLPEQDKAKFLSHQQMSLIASAVKLAPLQTSGELIRKLIAMYKILRPNTSMLNSRDLLRDLFTRSVRTSPIFSWMVSPSNTQSAD